MIPNSLGLTHANSFFQNGEKSLALASALFPREEWVLREPGIWVARSRLRDSARERAKLAWEIDQIRVLIDRDSAVCFLPEIENDDNLGKLSADTVFNGEIVEIKTVSGTRATLGTEFKKGYKQGAYLCRLYPAVKAHSVFVRLFSNLSPGSVKAKIAGELKERHGQGRFICYFEASGMLLSWTYEELKVMIGSGQKKSPGPVEPKVP
jgi:hypothetical protein